MRNLPVGADTPPYLMHADKAYFTARLPELDFTSQGPEFDIGTWAVGAKVTSQKGMMLCSGDRFQLLGAFYNRPCSKNMAVLASIKSSVMNATRL